MAKAPKSKLTVETLKHDDATRKNIPTAEYQSVMAKNEQSPVRVTYERRNRDLDLFVIFGEPDIDILDAEGGQVQVKVNGVDVFHPNSGEVRSDGAEGIACWFIDTDYNEESFFVRHAYFLGANDPYKALKTTLKAEINEEAWASLNSDTSRAFDKPKSGRMEFGRCA